MRASHSTSLPLTSTPTFTSGTNITTATVSTPGQATNTALTTTLTSGKARVSPSTILTTGKARVSHQPDCVVLDDASDDTRIESQPNEAAHAHSSLPAKGTSMTRQDDGPAYACRTIAILKRPVMWYCKVDQILYVYVFCQGDCSVQVECYAFVDAAYANRSKVCSVPTMHGVEQSLVTTH